MSLNVSSYRCALCGSNKVVMDKQKEGYSVSKGVLGTAILGAPGAVMGINGKDAYYYHCGACGQTLSYTMPSGLAFLIDLWLADPEAYKAQLAEKKQQYFNIEWDENNTSATAKQSNTANLEDMSLEELAGCILDYRKKKDISYIDAETLANEVLGSAKIKLYNVLNILKDKGLIKCEEIKNKTFCRFYSDADDIKNNILELDKKREEFENMKFEEKTAALYKNDEHCAAIILYLLKQNGKMTVTELIYADDELGIIFGKYNRQTYIFGLLSRMCENKLIGRLAIDKKAYYVLYDEDYEMELENIKLKEQEEAEKEKKREEAKKRQAEAKKRREEENRKYNEEATAFNTDLQKKIDNLKIEKAAQNKIYEENRKKIFGQGAKDKKQALVKMYDLDKQIADLKKQFKELK